MSNEMLFGMSEKNLAKLDNGILVHENLVAPFYALKEKSIDNGFEIEVASGFRSFERQQYIWNEKSSGLRKLYDKSGKVLLEYNELSEDELLFAILRWSAIPGLSRHHWGTEIDIYDKRALGETKLELSIDEVEGIFSPMYKWLSDQIESSGFFRPYFNEKNGVSPEMWHLSLKSESEKFEKDLTIENCYNFIKSHPEIALQENILKNLDEIFERFIKNHFLSQVE